MHSAIFLCYLAVLSSPHIPLGRLVLMEETLYNSTDQVRNQMCSKNFFSFEEYKKLKKSKALIKPNCGNFENDTPLPPRFSGGVHEVIITKSNSQTRNHNSVIPSLKQKAQLKDRQNRTTVKPLKAIDLSQNQVIIGGPRIIIGGMERERVKKTGDFKRKLRVKNVIRRGRHQENRKVSPEMMKFMNKNKFLLAERCNRFNTKRPLQCLQDL
ncbi:unnamed protein product [Moneuplotes crassus]|uniref:Uncharacterized protein n=1 Tax=Euplotes crassus TaxID=5936 RepID=A0AAD1X7M7_EUPCR|nr:unnamed protein product [Moneuplotes crassus]